MDTFEQDSDELFESIIEETSVPQDCPEEDFLVSSSHLDSASHHQDQMINLLKLEADLLDTIASEKEKIQILFHFYQMKAFPDLETIRYLFLIPGSLQLKKTVFKLFVSVIDEAFIIQWLLNMNISCIPLKEQALHCAAKQAQFPIPIIEKILQNPIEKAVFKSKAVEFFSGRISISIIESIIQDQNAEEELRKRAIQGASIRFDFDLDILLTLICDKNETLEIKICIFKSFNNRISMDQIKLYLLDESIDPSEKTEILSLIYPRHADLKKEGTIDLLYMIMRDYAQGRQLILEKIGLSEQMIQQLLKDAQTQPKVKKEILGFCQEKLNSPQYKNFINELLCEGTINETTKSEFLGKFSQLITVKTITNILVSPENSMEFRDNLLSQWKNKIRFGRSTHLVEPILYNPNENFTLKKKLLRHFYNYFPPETIFNWIQKDLHLTTQIRPVLYNLKQISFFKNHPLFIKRLLKMKLAPLEAMLVLEVFVDEIDAKEITKLLPHIILNPEDIPYVLNKIGFKDKKKEILSFLIESYPRFSKIVFQLIMNHYQDLSSKTLSKILFAPEFPIDYKITIIRKDPLKTDLNDHGTLDYLFSDQFENVDLRIAVYERYKSFLKKSVIQKVKSDRTENPDLQAYLNTSKI